MFGIRIGFLDEFIEAVGELGRNGWEFSLGCLSHLIQDRVVFPHAHRKFEEFEKAVGKHDLEDEWRDEEVPLKDGSTLDELGFILKMDNPVYPPLLGLSYAR